MSIYSLQTLLILGDLMSKTEEVIKALNEGKDTATIKEEVGASESLISRCRGKLAALKPAETPEEEENPSDEELEAIITKIKITPEEKFLTKDKKAEDSEEYHCMGCSHTWKAKEMPLSCPSCGSEF